MNNRKIIFFVIIWLLVIWLLIFLIIAKTNKRAKVSMSSWNFVIWTVWDSASKFKEFLSDFKSKNKEFSRVNFDVVSFSNYKDYSLALKSAFLKNKAPDIFVLNNNEKSIFEEKILAIPNSVINIHKFRQEYKSIFTNDLIVETDDKNEEKSFLKWVPVGYETLWIFYNKFYRLKKFHFVSMSSLLSAIKKVNERQDAVPIALWNWENISYAGDILAQFLMLNKVKSLVNWDDAKIRDSLSEYIKYYTWENNFSSLFQDDYNKEQKDIDLFIDKKVAAIIAYPRIIKKLESSWFTNRFLAATAFPHYFKNDWDTLANYNYFVINQDTNKKNIAFWLLKFLATDTWAKAFLDKFRYYLPACETLEETLADRKISKFYDNIVLSDFYSEEHPLSSFDKLNKVIYDEKIKEVLDKHNSILSKFSQFKNYLLCEKDKILELKNLSKKCE